LVVYHNEKGRGCEEGVGLGGGGGKRETNMKENGEGERDTILAE
jgi:hypothetical protein